MDCSAVYILLGFVIIFVVLELRRAAEQRRFTYEIRLEISGLLNRLSLLEKRLARLSLTAAPEERGAAPPVTVVSETPPAVVKIPPPAPLPEIAPPPPPPAPEEAPVPPPPAAAPVPIWRRPGLEEQLGARVPVWIGSIALALAGAFLVKYSFERQWLSPTVRVVLGVLFGIGLLAGGEILRRKAERISQGLSAAGIADLFACFLAGVHLYGLISPGVGFALMALTTVVAVVLSLRQGIMVALIGLIGGLLTPYLMRTGEPNVRGLFLYLLLLQVGLLTVARRRGWPWIAGLALGGGLVWAIAWLVEPFRPQDSPWLGGFLLLSVLAALAAGWSRAQAPGPPGFLRMSWAAVPGGLLALGLLAGRAGYTTTEWAYFGLLAAGTLVLARLRPDFEGLAWIAAGAGAALLGAWGWAVAEPDLDRFLLTAAGLGILFAGGSWLALRGSARPGRWGALCAASGLAFFLLAWASTHTQREMRWGVFSLVLAALYLAASLPVARWRRQRPEMDVALAALAVAVTSFVSLAVPLELERHWLSVAWALEVAALVWLAARFRLPILRHLSLALAVLVGVRLLLNASILDYPIGEHPVFHWLLYGYGLPLLAFAVAAFLARRQEDGRLATLLEAETLAFAFALVTLEARQIYHPGRPGVGAVGLGEWGSLLSAWILLGWGLLAANRRLRLQTVELGAQVVLGLAAATALLGPVLASNARWAHVAVGETPVFNLLLWTYGLPAALLAFAAAELRRDGSTRLAGALTVVVLVLAFVLVSLEVRQAFHGTYLDTGFTSLAEGYSYSAAWILFGVALLVLGILRKGKALRYAALVVMLLAVAKVFLYDTSNLAGLYRVFSFLGLGVSLLVLAWVYQQFVFRESA